MNPRRLLLLLPEIGVVKVILLKWLLLLLLLGQGLLEILIVDSTGHLLLLLLGLSHGCGIEYAWRLGW